MTIDPSYFILSITHLIAGAFLWATIGERMVVPLIARYLRKRDERRGRDA